MKTFTLASLLITGAAFANTALLSVQRDGDITHLVEQIETPKSTINQDEEKNLVSSYAEDVSPLVVIDTIINLGQKIWTIIEKGKPVVNVQFQYATALPEGVRSSRELDGWSDVQYQSYRMSGKNLYGVTVYDVTYTTAHRYNAQYRNVGRYSTDISIIPLNVDTLWGYTVDYGVTNISTVNVGTRENPIASLAMELKFEVSTVIKSHKTRMLYEFRGDSPTVRASSR